MDKAHKPSDSEYLQPISTYIIISKPMRERKFLSSSFSYPLRQFHTELSTLIPELYSPYKLKHMKERSISCYLSVQKCERSFVTIFLACRPAEPKQ
jgi:hypothetical protein